MTSLNILYVEDDQRAAAEVQQLAAERGDTDAWESTGSGGLLRAGPSGDATEVRTLRAGTALTPTGQRDGLFIEVEDNYGTKGWVSVEDLA